MLVSLIKGNKIDNHYLPSKVIGNYWIKDNDNKLIQVESMNGKWCLFSNKEISVIENNEEVKYVYLQEYTFYLLKINETNNFMLLYCSPIYDETYKKYSININEITIGQATGNYIYYNNSGVDELHATIYKKDKKIFITDNNSRLGVYVNSTRVIKNKVLSHGDVIFLAGLKIIISLENDNFTIFVNNPDNLVKCRLQEIKTKEIYKNYLDYKITNEDLITNDKALYKKNEYIEKKNRVRKDIKKISYDLTNVKKSEVSKYLIYLPVIILLFIGIILLFISLLNNALGLIFISIIIFIFAFIWPFIIKLINSKATKEVEDILENVKNNIEIELQEQKDIIVKEYLTLKECEDTILNRNIHIWEKSKYDDDFLTINIGLGNQNALIDDSLTEEFKINNVLSDMPVNISLKNNKLLSLIGNRRLTKKFIEQIILQIITLHSYDDVKLVVLTCEENENKWHYLKNLPYLFSNDKLIRYFASNKEEINYVCDNIDYSNHHYIIITDNIKECINNKLIFEHINNNIDNISLLILDDNVNNVPNLCNTFIRVTDKESNYYQNILNGFNIKFKIDFDTKVNIKDCFKRISNIPINNNKFILPNNYSLLEMYEVGKVEQLNVYERWNGKQLKNSLKTCVGINEYGSLINIDLQNKYKSTHALIVGIPGSGKTQFIVTYILSMCINFNPNDIQFIILEDDKELSNIFNLEHKLPHLSGVFNFDGVQLKRFMMAFKNELTRRRNVFIETEKTFKEKYVDIDKYQELYNNKKVNMPISHIFIVIDEYNKLEEKHPKFVEKLIKISHISSDLGVHFIFSVDKNKMKEEDFTNLFGSKILMYDLNDNDNISNPPGRFYYNNLIGHGANSDVNYKPSYKYNKVIDSSVEFINNIGIRIKKNDITNSFDDYYGKENINIVKYLKEVSQQVNIKSNPLCLDNLCSYATVASLMKGYGVVPEKGLVEPVIGEYEDLNNNVHNILRLGLSKGNSVVHSINIKENECLINSMLFSSMYLYTKEEVNYHIIDMHDNSFSAFDKCPLLISNISSNQIDIIDKLFKDIDNIIEERSKLFDDYLSSDRNLPLIVVVINDFNRFSRQYTKYMNNINNILNMKDFGIRFVFTITEEIPNVLNNKKYQYLALKQFTNRDYNKIFKRELINYPEDIFGRGLTDICGNICEFQLSYVNPKNKEYTAFVLEQCNECSKDYKEEEKKIPDKITIKHVKHELGKSDDMIIGYDDKSSMVSYNFYENIVNIVSGNNKDVIGNFIRPLIKQFAYLNKSEVIVFNALENTVGSNINNLKYIDSNFDDNLSLLERYINKIYSLYIDKKIKKFDDRYRVVFIYGFSDLRNKLNIENKNKLGSLIEKVNKMNIVHFIIADDYKKLKNLESEKWYKEYVDRANGIWVGNDIEKQSVFKCNSLESEKLKDNQCYIIKDSKLIKTQYVESFDIIENEK